MKLEAKMKIKVASPASVSIHFECCRSLTFLQTNYKSNVNPIRRHHLTETAINGKGIGNLKINYLVISQLKSYLTRSIMSK